MESSEIILISQVSKQWNSQLLRVSTEERSHFRKPFCHLRKTSLMLEFLMNTTFLFEILLLLAPEIHLGSLFFLSACHSPMLTKRLFNVFFKMCVVLFFSESSFRRQCPLLFPGTEKLIFPVFHYYFLVCLFLRVCLVFCFCFCFFCLLVLFVFWLVGGEVFIVTRQFRFS